MDDSTPIKALRNLGPEYEYWLNKVGVYTLADLKKQPLLEIVNHLEQVGFKPSENILELLQGALVDKDWQDVVKD